MPNAQTYRGFADDLDTAAIDIAQAGRPLTTANRGDFVEGGRLSTVIDLAIDATHSNISGTVSALGMLATQCRERAAVCDQYRAEMIHYNRQQSLYYALPSDDRDGIILPNRPSAPDWADWY